MSTFLDDIFTQVQSSVSLDSLVIETEPTLEICHEDFKTEDTLALVNASYRILIVKNMQYIATRSLEKNRQCLLDVLEEYSRYIDFYPQIYEQKSGHVPLNMTICTYYIALNPKNNVRKMLDFIISVDNIGSLSNRIQLFTTSKNLGVYYGHYDSEVSPNGELVNYLRDLKYGDMPFSYYLNNEQFMKDVQQMRVFTEAMVCSLFSGFDDYNYYHVVEETRKWLRTSKQRWVVGQIGEQKIKYDDYQQKARQYYENRRFIHKERGGRLRSC